MRTYTPRQLADYLANLPISETVTAALENAAAGLADAVRESLSTPANGPHDAPWLQTGTLRASIAHSADDNSAVVGSNDPAAAPQELGTAAIPPQPFLAPTAAAQAEDIARRVGSAVAELFLRE